MGLKEIYYSVEDKYYGAIEWLSKNGLNLKPLVSAIEAKGIPTLPLFTAVLLLIIGGAVLFTNPAILANLGLASSNVELKVQTSSGEAISGALVTLTGTDLNTSVTTDENGVASFSGLQEGKRLSVSISKEGYAVQIRSFIVGSPVAPFILRTATTSMAGAVNLLVTTSDDEPIEGASVSYTVNQQTRTARTDENGIAQLNAAIGASIRVVVTAQGYSSKTETFTAAATHTVKLTVTRGSFDIDLGDPANGAPSPHDPANVTGARRNLAGEALVTVNVVNETGAQLSGAAVTLLDSGNSVLDSNVTNVNGTATFSDIAHAITIYAAAEKEGYISEQSASRTVAAGLVLTITLKTPNENNSVNLTLNLAEIDAVSRTSSISADVTIYKVDGQEEQKQLTQLPRATRTQVIPNLEIGTTIYFSIYSASHVRLATPEITLDSTSTSFTVNLTKKTPENSVNVKVNVVDFYNEPTGANVSVKLENGHYLAPALAARSGFVEFANMPLQLVLFHAVNFSNGAFDSDENLTVSPENNNVTLKLLPLESFLSLKAIGYTVVNGEMQEDDTITEQTEFTVSYEYRGQKVIVTGCPQANPDLENGQSYANGFCPVSLRANIPYTITARSEGYFDKVQHVIPDVGIMREPVLVEMSSTSNSQVIPDGTFKVYMRDGTTEVPINPPDATDLTVLKAGEIYRAVFTIVNVHPDAIAAGVYLRMGSDSSGLSNDNAFIFKGFPLNERDSINYMDPSEPNPVMLKGGNSYSSTSCGDEVAANEVGVFKWINAEKNVTETGTSFKMIIPFMVTKSTSPNRLNLSYRGYNILANDTYLRSPTDTTLGQLRQTRSAGECGAAVNISTFKVIPLENTLVQCSQQACLKLSFEQESRTSPGPEGFIVKPAILSNENTGEIPIEFVLNYKIIDFNPDLDNGRQLTFQTDKTFIQIMRTEEQEGPYLDFGGIERFRDSQLTAYNVKNTENKYSMTSKTNYEVSGKVRTRPTKLADPEYPIALSYGGEQMETIVNLVGLPQIEVSLAPLPSHYILSYIPEHTAAAKPVLELSLRNGATTTPVEAIDFYADPFLPADALLLQFNFTKAPSQERSYRLIDPTGCFEVVEDPKTVLQLPEEYTPYADNLMLLKYDASKQGKCSLFAKNPNAIKTKDEAATLVIMSYGTDTQIEIPLNVKFYLDPGNVQVENGDDGVALTKFNSPYRAVVAQEKVWTESGIDKLNLEPSYIHAIINNRQYSGESNSRVAVFQGGGEETENYYLVSDNAIILPAQTVKPIVTHDATLPDNLWGVPTTDLMDLQLKVYGPGRSVPITNSSGTYSVKVDNQPDSMVWTKAQVLNVLNNTVFRRRQQCTPTQPCPFAMFPYNAFVDIKTKPVVFHLGGDLWTGKTGSGNVTFDFYGLNGEPCSQRAQEGVYDYYWEYKLNDNGDFVQEMKFKPLEVESTNYANDFSCSNTQQLCGKLSIGGGQCVRNCGDGWYFDAIPGETVSTLCSQNVFRLDDLRASSAKQSKTLFAKFAANIPNAIASCIASEMVGATGGCAIGQYVGGPAGGFVGTQLGSLTAGKLWDVTAGNAIDDAIIGDLEVTESDVPGFAQFVGKWAEVCNYAGTAMDVANAVAFMKNTAAISNYECPGIIDNALSKCLCVGTGINSVDAFDEGCFASKAARLFISSTAVRSYRAHFTETAGEVTDSKTQLDSAQERFTKARKKPNVATVCSASSVVSCTNRGQVNGAISIFEAEAVKDTNTPEVRASNAEFAADLKDYRDANDKLVEAENTLNENAAQARAQGFCSERSSNDDCAAAFVANGEKLGILDSAYNAVCGPLLTAQVAFIIAGQAYSWDQIPDRAYLSINKEGATDFGGGFLGFGGSGVDCADNTDLSQENFDVWTDLDFSSLRIKPEVVTQCMDKPEIRTYAPEEDETINGLNVKDKIATFYITSEDHG